MQLHACNHYTHYCDDFSPLHAVTGASPPTDLSAQPASPTSIRISWTPPVPEITVAGYIINYQAEGDQDSPIKNGSVDIFANATQHTLSDLQEGLWYTITMVAKSRSTVAGPVRVTLSKFTNPANMPMTMNFIGCSERSWAYREMMVTYLYLC